MGGRVRKRRRLDRASTNGKVRGSVPIARQLHQLPPKQLRQFATSTNAEIERLRTQIKATEATIGDLQQVLNLIARLETRREPRRGINGLSHVEVVADILGTTGRPMRLQELVGALAGRGVVIAGKTPRIQRSNLIIALGRRPALVRRVGRGLYALAEWRQSA
jgi:hypothetical protein